MANAYLELLKGLNTTNQNNTGALSGLAGLTNFTSAISTEKTKSEYIANLVAVFDEINPDTGKPYYQQIPGCFWVLDNVQSKAEEQVPKAKASKNVVNEMKCAVVPVCKDLLTICKNIPVGERELVFFLDYYDEEGNAVSTGLAIEIYHVDNSGETMEGTRFKAKSLLVS